MSPCQPSPEPPKTETIVATGTGFIINDRGDVVTNNHVVDGCSLIKFVLNGQDLVQGRLVASDTTNEYHQRHKIAAQAITDFEASKTLARAREAVKLAVAKHKVEQHVSPEIAQDSEVTLKAMREVERGWQRAMDKIAERCSLTRPWIHKPAAIVGWLA